MQPIGQVSAISRLDALRGFAVMGILAMNIAAFDMPFMAYLSPRDLWRGHGADLASWFAQLHLLRWQNAGFCFRFCSGPA